MQVQKTNIRSRILKVSEEMFLKKGYKGTSMRDVAKEAEISLCNIYNYFENKDRIYEKVLSPVLQKLDAMIEEHRNMDVQQYMDRERLEAADGQTLPDVISRIMKQSEHFSISRNIQQMVDLVEGNRDYLYLLLFNSTGSKYEHYKEDFTKRMTETMTEVMNRIEKEVPEFGRGMRLHMSSFFIHVNTNYFFAVLEELVLHNMEGPERDRFIEEYVVYSTGGFEAILRR